MQTVIERQGYLRCGIGVTGWWTIGHLGGRGTVGRLAGAPTRIGRVTSRLPGRTALSSSYGWIGIFHLDVRLVQNFKLTHCLISPLLDRIDEKWILPPVVSCATDGEGVLAGRHRLKIDSGLNGRLEVLKLCSCGGVHPCFEIRI